MSITILNHEEGEEVGVLDDDGDYVADGPLAEDVLSDLAGGVDHPVAETGDAASGTRILDVRPGDRGYLRAAAEALPSPLEADPDDVEGLEPPRAPTATSIEDEPYSAADLEALAEASDAIEEGGDDRGRYFEDVETKERVYVSSPAEAPEGANVSEGDRGGLHYDTDDVEAFDEAMAAIEERVREQHDFTDEQWAEAEEAAAAHRARSEGLFEAVVEAAGLPGGTEATHRVKSPVSMLEKVHEREDASADEIGELGDVFGAKIVPGGIDEVRETAEALQENLEDEVPDIAEVEYDDQLDPDEDTYYRAVHVDFETEDGLRGEIQLKSEEMEEIIDVGHDTVYKNNAGLDEDLIDEIDDCLTAYMDELFGEPASPGEDCTGGAQEAIAEMR